MGVVRDTRYEIRDTRYEIRDTKVFGRIGVLMGGPSSEREISFKSGKAVCDAFTELGLEIVPIDVKTDSVEENLSLIKSQKINCAFIALHGRFGEDGGIQEILEILRIPYTGSGVSASKLAMDKVASRKIFEKNGLNVPAYKVLRKNLDPSNPETAASFNLPLVIKPVAHGSSIGLSIINGLDEFDRALDLAFSFDDNILIEEYISGREMTVGILDDQALAVIEIIPKRKFFDYEAKYQSGLTEYIVPAKIEEALALKIQEAALFAHRLLGCFGCSRVDIMLGKFGLPFILEVNTIPGLTSTSLLPKAAKIKGLDFPQLCLKLIELAYEKTKV